MTFADFCLILFSFSSFIQYYLLNFVWDHKLECIVLAITCFMFYISTKNQQYIKETKSRLNGTLEQSKYRTKVSVLVAARNEENNIERCVRSLMSQSYLNYEILVMNDNSTDETGRILATLKREFDGKAKSKDKLKFFTNTNLPSGWYGKSWSIQCLYRKANGKILIMTDADTVHNFNSIKFCVHCVTTDKLDFLSGFPKQNLNSFGSKLLVPSMYIMSSYLIPLWLTDSMLRRDVSFAIGQLMVVRKAVFDEVNGLEQVSHHICEDLQLARLLKGLNFKTKFIPMEEHVTCNMYDSFKDAFKGMAKNVFSAIDYSYTKYFYVTLIFFAIIYPVCSLPTSNTWTEFSIYAISICLFTFTWIKTLTQHQLSFKLAFLYPLMIFCLFFVSAYATYNTFLAPGHSWRGRIVH